MEFMKNIPTKEIPILTRRKTKRPIIVQDIDSDNENLQRDDELDFENINLNYERYCYLCHKEINIIPESHLFFKCMTCNKYFHKECYKEYKLKQAEKDLCQNIIKISKINNNNNGNKKKNLITGKECILCVMQNNNYCTICKKKLNKENELIIECELCGNLMHFKCLDVPLYFIFYRELYKNIFNNNGIKQQKYKEFLLKIKEINNKEINEGFLSNIYENIKIKPFSLILNYLFYVCHFCKTRNLYDLQEINVYKSTSFSKVNFYNTTLNPISQNINKVNSSWNLNKIHEIYISSSNPYNDALFDKEKYDNNYEFPFPVKIIKKYEYNRINNIIIKNVEINKEKEKEEKELNKNDNKNNITEEEIFELSNIVQMFEDGENKEKQNKNEINDNNKKIINDDISENNIEKGNSEKMDVVSDNNNDPDEQEKSENDLYKNITIEDKCFYLIKWNTLEYSLELDSFMETFPNFKQILSDYTKEELVNYNKKEEDNYQEETDINKIINKILIQLGLNTDINYANLNSNSFIYKTKEEISKYKENIVSIIKHLLNINEVNIKLIPHILILNDSSDIKSKDDLEILLEKNNINHLNLKANKETFIYECINFKEDLFSDNNELNVLKISNNIYLHKNKKNILEEDNIKRYVNQNILIDIVDSKNISFLQEYNFDLIIFDLKNIKSLLKIKEFFKKITSPLNPNYDSLKYILLEQSIIPNNYNEQFSVFNNIIQEFFNLFYNKEDTILLYGNYTGKNIEDKLNDNTENDKDNLKHIILFPNTINAIEEKDLDPFYNRKNFINLNFSSLLYNKSFNGLYINNMKWAFYFDRSNFHYTQILTSIFTKYDTKVFSLRSKDYNEIIMNFIPIYLDKETFIQYLYIMKNKPEVLLKTQENKKDLLQNILLLSALPNCMTKFYKKYLEDFKLNIKDNINISKIDVFYQLSRILLNKTKGKIIIIFPLSDKVYRDNELLLRKIRKEIEKIFFSNINPDNKEINLKERKKNFFCFLMDEEGLFEEIKNSEKAKYPTNIIIFNMFLQNKNTGEFFDMITKNKYRHKIILYQLYISNLIEGKLSQIFYSKLNQFIEIGFSPLKKMKTSVYGQLNLIDKEIITISDLKSTFEKEIINSNNESELNSGNDISKINIVTSYDNLVQEEKNFDGFIFIQKNSYLICTNSNKINLRFDNIYNTFVGNVSFNNCDNAVVNSNNSDGEKRSNSGIEIYNENLVKYKKKKFYQELDFLKDESNFENMNNNSNKYDLTSTSNNETNINSNGNNNLNMNFTLNQNGIRNTGINLNNHRGDEVYILNDSNDNYGGHKKKKGRKKKNIGNENNINNNNNNNPNENREPIQIQNDEENEDMNSVLSDEVRSNHNANNNIINNPISDDNNNDLNSNNENRENNQYENIPVNLDEITEDYSDTFSENSQERNMQIKDKENNQKEEKEESQIINQENINKKEIENNDKNNNNKNEINKDLNQPEANNNEKTYDIIKSIANSILSKKQDQNNYQEHIPNPQTLKNTESEINPQDIEQVEKLINETKLESSRDRLFKIYNYLLIKGFEEKTRKLFVKCLLNYGFPLVNEFNKFYLLFQMNAQHLKLKNIPNKVDSQLYYELVYYILEEEESLDYNIFVFGEERTSLIRTKLLIIRQFQSFKDVTKAMYHFVKDKYNLVFGHIEPKLDESYQRVHFVIAKILSNIVSKSIKSGFLNYKNYIKDDNIIFDNIRIKKDGQTPSVVNIREGIAKKIFGKPMNEKEFNEAITNYYEALFVQLIKVPENIVNSNNESIIR